MAYGSDLTVFVEDKAGDLGAPASPAPWWLSPDIDLPAHTGLAVQGANEVQIRVHSHEEPILDEKIVAEVYVGMPSLVMSPAAGTTRIDPGTLKFRPPGVAGSEPIANEAGGTLSFQWTPSASATDPGGPGHRCLIVRAFPESVTPPNSPFDVPNEQHEAQHNIEVLTTTMDFVARGKAGAGTKKDPRRRHRTTGMWSQELATMAAGRRGKRVVVWALDPSPNKELVAAVRESLGRSKFSGFSKDPPSRIALEAVRAPGVEVDPQSLLKRRGFVSRSGLGEGLFAEDRLLAAASLDLGPRKLSGLVLSFDHSNLKPRTAVVLHGAQWSEQGVAEGGMTVVALAPIDN